MLNRYNKLEFMKLLVGTVIIERPIRIELDITSSMVIATKIVEYLEEKEV